MWLKSVAELRASGEMRVSQLAQMRALSISTQSRGRTLVSDYMCAGRLVSVGYEHICPDSTLATIWFQRSKQLELVHRLNLNTTVIGHTINLDLTSPSDPKATLLVYAILFRSIPTYVAGLFINTIIPSIDLNMRFMQPFVEMLPIVQQPGQAAKTALLDYITLSSLQVPLTAYANEHYKVSWFSTLNTISPLFPIFVGGLLTVSPTPNGEHVHLSFSLSAYIGIIVSLVLYSISLPFGYPHAHRLLPR